MAFAEPAEMQPSGSDEAVRLWSPWTLGGWRFAAIFVFLCSLVAFPSNCAHLICFWWSKAVFPFEAVFRWMVPWVDESRFTIKDESIQLVQQ